MRRKASTQGRNICDASLSTSVFFSVLLAALLSICSLRLSELKEADCEPWCSTRKMSWSAGFLGLDLSASIFDVPTYAEQSIDQTLYDPQRLIVKYSVRLRQTYLLWHHENNMSH